MLALTDAVSDSSGTGRNNSLSRVGVLAPAVTVVDLGGTALSRADVLAPTAAVIDSCGPGRNRNQ